MRLILDTNVVTSALLWGGTPYRLFKMAIDQQITLYTSPARFCALDWLETGRRVPVF